MRKYCAGIKLQTTETASLVKSKTDSLTTTGTISVVRNKAGEVAWSKWRDNRFKHLFHWPHTVEHIRPICLTSAALKLKLTALALLLSPLSWLIKIEYSLEALGVFDSRLFVEYEKM